MRPLPAGAPTLAGRSAGATDPAVAGKDSLEETRPQRVATAPPAETRDLWVVVRGAPSVTPHQVECEVEDMARPSLDLEGDSSGEGEGEEGAGPSGGGGGGSTGGAYVAVDREDVVDAVAEFVRGRMVSHMEGHNYEPTEIAAAVDVALSDEKQHRWRRVWGRGRFLYRSATFLGGIVGELKPSGRAGAALRGASNRALGLVGSAPPAQLGDS